MVARAVVVATCVLYFGLSLLDGGLLGWEYVDAYGTQWYYHHTAAALAAGRSPLPAGELFHPWGKDVLHTAGGNLLDAVLAAPWSWAFGATWGYDVFVVGAHTLAAWLVFRFALAVTGDGFAAAVGALIFASDPWVLGELALGRPTQALLPLLVGVVYALWRLHDQPSGRRALVAGLCLGLLGHQYWYYGLFAAFGATAFGLGSLAAPGPRRARVSAYALAAVTAAVIVLPAALPLAVAAADGTAPGLLDTTRWTWLRTPPLTREGVHVSLMHWQPVLGWHGSLGAWELGAETFFPTLWHPAWAPVVAAVALWWAPARLPRAAVIGVMAVAGVIAVGPFLLLGPWSVPNALYIGLAQRWPVWQRLWWPDRAYALLAVLVPVLLAGGLAALRGAPRLRVGLGALGLLANAAALREAGLLPFPTWRPQVEAGFRCLAQAEEGAVVVLPWAWSQRSLVAQAVHGRPVLGGMNERDPSFAPPDLTALTAKNAAVADLVTPHVEYGAPLRPWGDEELAALGRLGYRWIVFQLDALPGRTAAEDGLRGSLALERFRALQGRLGDPVYRDARMIIWAPWGHGSPCADRPPPRDLEPLGRTETSLDLHLDRAVDLTGPGRGRGGG